MGPCMCGDTECPWCGPLQGNGVSIAEGLFQLWESESSNTTQDLSDLCAGEDDAVCAQLPDGERWTFVDGSSIELVWGSPHTCVRDARGDVVP